MRRGYALVLVAVQLVLALVGFVLTARWMVGAGVWHGWAANLPMVVVLLASLVVFSHEEARHGLAAARRRGEESMGGWLEAVAFATWVVLLLNMIATVAKVIRAIRGGT